MAKAKLKAGEWLSPKEVLAIAEKAHGQFGAKIVMERINGGLLLAMASRVSDAYEGDEPEITDEPSPLPADIWIRLQDATTFWERGDAKFYFYNPGSLNRTVRCFDIKFLKKTVNAQFPVPGAPLAKEPETAQETEVVVDERPSVAEANLKLWAKVFLEVYPDGTLDFAWKSARGMFPDKSVTRKDGRAPRCAPLQEKSGTFAR